MCDVVSCDVVEKISHVYAGGVKKALEMCHVVSYKRGWK
jgi:hypothetical protein